MSNELIHYGVPGMKWGVRHDKPSSGRSPYTKAKRASEIRKMSDEDLRKSNTRHAAENLYKKNHPTDEESITKVFSDMNQNVNKINNGFKNLSSRKRQSKRTRQIEIERKKQMTEKLKNMSDSELRAVVNRMNMEQQYERLSNNDIQSGKDRVGDVLDSIGDALVIAGGAAALAVNIQKLTKRLT